MNLVKLLEVFATHQDHGSHVALIPPNNLHLKWNLLVKNTRGLLRGAPRCGNADSLLSVFSGILLHRLIRGFSFDQTSMGC